MFIGSAVESPRRGHVLASIGVFLALSSIVAQTARVPIAAAFGSGEIASLSNQYRAGAGLAALSLNGQLSASAQNKANDMTAGSYFAHDSPSGATPWDFIAYVGYAYDAAGENLALTNEGPTSVVDGWYNSPGHRANMLSGTFTEVGYGISYAPTFVYNGNTYNDVYLVAAHYGVPTYVAPPPDPTPTAAPQPSPAPTPTTAAEPEVAEEAVISDTPAPASDSAQQPLSATQPDPTVEAASAPNDNLVSVAPKAREVPEPVAIAGVSTGGGLMLVGSTIEIRRLLHHQSLAFWKKSKKKK